MTEARQAHCNSTYASNAAIYLESVLHNLQAASYATCEYADQFASAIFTYPVAQAWADRVVNEPSGSVDVDTAQWRRLGLRRWKLQVHKDHDVWMVETIIVGSAVGP